MVGHKSFFPLDFLRSAQTYNGAVVGIKLSGKCLEDAAVQDQIVRQVVTLSALGAKVALVHGGGKQITRKCQEEGIEKREIQGLRYTTPRELEIATECVQALTASLVEGLRKAAAEMGLKISARGVSAYEGGLITAGLHSAAFEGSRTGRITGLDKEALRSYLDGHILVLNPICAGEDGGHWNVNADDVIEAAAKAAGAVRVVMCSDTALYDKDGKTITKLYTDDIQRYVDDGSFNDQLAPKVKAVAELANNVCPVSIVNGALPNAIDLELYTEEGGGTLIEKRSA